MVSILVMLEARQIAGYQHFAERRSFLKRQFCVEIRLVEQAHTPQGPAG